MDPIIAALVTALISGVATLGVARYQQIANRKAGSAVQSAEQVAAERLITDAEEKAERVKDEAEVKAASVIVRAQEIADRTGAEREAWHESQVLALKAEIDKRDSVIDGLRARLEERAS